jgi:hypothetical protein
MKKIIDQERKTMTTVIFCMGASKQILEQHFPNAWCKQATISLLFTHS